MAAKQWRTVGKLLLSLIAAGVLVAGVAMPFVLGTGLTAGREASRFLDTSCNLRESQPPQKTTLLARDGKTVLATLFDQDRVPVPLSQVPTYLQEALIATEDRRFYSHHGVDLRGLLRSAVSTSSGSTQGGSTLTMQYVKQIRYYQAGNDLQKQQAAISVSLNRKIEDAKCALYIEGTLHESKQTILDNYLNIAFFGENSFGIETAAQTYFDRPVSKLTLDQAALLVGLLRAPSAYDPFVNRTAAKLRRDQVLQNLVSVGKLSQAAANKVEQTPIQLATQSAPLVKEGCANATTTLLNSNFFCNYAVSWLENVNGISATTLQTGGLKIVTTLDPALQNSMQRQVSKTVPATSPSVAVLPAVDPKTGDVLAMATSRKYGSTGPGETEQPLFTSTTAQGASTFKLFPLLVALSTGVPSGWQLQTVGNTGTYKPSNCLTQGSGAGNGDASIPYNALESLQTATAKSSNTYFLALANDLLDCHLQPITDLMSQMGISALQQPGDLPHETLAQTIVNQQRAQQLVLGSVPVSALQLAGAYAAVANGGVYNAPAPIKSISDAAGNEIAVKRTPGVPVVSPFTAAQAVKILTGDTVPGGTSATSFSGWYANGGSAVAGKTGTNPAVDANGKASNKNGAIWFVGMTPGVVAASGLINFDGPSSPNSGLPGVPAGAAYGDYAAKVWEHALAPALARQQWTWTPPAAVDGAVVPTVTDLSVGQARKVLAENNYKMTILDAADGLLCPATAPLGTVGYYGPHRAAPGATITVCPSSSVAQYTPPPPPVVYVPPVTAPHRRTTAGTGRRTGTGTRTGSGTRTGTAPGGGRNGNRGGRGNGAGSGPGGG